MVSASFDQTLKVRELESYVCRYTHCRDAAYLAVAATTIAIIAGDGAGSVWFLDAPGLERSRPAAMQSRVDRGPG
jgi:hypothetical protein